MIIWANNPGTITDRSGFSPLNQWMALCGGSLCSIFRRSPGVTLGANNFSGLTLHCLPEESLASIDESSASLKKKLSGASQHRSQLSFLLRNFSKFKRTSHRTSASQERTWSTQLYWFIVFHSVVVCFSWSHNKPCLGRTRHHPACNDSAAFIATYACFH